MTDAGRWIAITTLPDAAARSAALRPLAGRPLLAWTLHNLIDAACFAAVYVRCDDALVRHRLGTEFAQRVGWLGAHEAPDPTADLIAHVAPGAALFDGDRMRAACARVLREGLDELVGVDGIHGRVWDSASKLVIDTSAASAQVTAWVESGTLRITRRADTGATAARRMGFEVMHEGVVVMPDDQHLWTHAEQQLRARIRARHAIRLLVVDVDGTLTDGGMYYDANGEALKKFDTRDAKGMLLLREQGVRVCVVTAETSAVVTARMRKLGIQDYFPGVSDKRAWLEEQCAQWGIDYAQVAYIGDDLNDLPGLALVGLSCCPADAVPEVHAAVKYRCAARGGSGAVREVCDLLRGGDSS